MWRRDLLISLLVAGLALTVGQVAVAQLNSGADRSTAASQNAGGANTGVVPGDTSHGQATAEASSVTGTEQRGNLPGPGSSAAAGAGSQGRPSSRPGNRGGADDPASIAKPTGRLRVVPGSSRAKGPGVPLRFIVEVEGGLKVDRRAFASRVERVLFDGRGWRAGGVGFRRVDSGRAAFRVALASRNLTDRLCSPLATVGLYSCHQGGRAVLNAWRWRNGADAYGRRLRHYRIYMINHEVGHALGHGHAACPSPGRRAPVMMQQTIGIGACKPNPWPLPHEH